VSTVLEGVPVASETKVVAKARRRSTAAEKLRLPRLAYCCAESGELNAPPRPERRDWLRHPCYAAPQLLATRPNQPWSRGITKPPGPTKWSHSCLHVLLDVFSRYVVGWTPAWRERAVIAESLIADGCTRQGIEPGQLAVHADRGGGSCL